MPEMWSQEDLELVKLLNSAIIEAAMILDKKAFKEA